jgi:hypothetical protein
VLHSFHYPGRKVGRGKGCYEQYARNAALALRDLQVQGVTVVESPIKRYFPRLLQKHEANWALDLHDDLGGTEWETEPYPICDVAHAWPSEPTKSNDSAWRARVERAKNILMDFREQTYGRRLWYDSNPPFFVSPGSGSLDPRVFGIELYARRPLFQALDFLKKLTNYLQSVTL